MPRRGSGNGATTRRSGMPNIGANEAQIFRSIAAFVASGHADCEIVGNGDVQLRLDTGRIFLLRATTITRVA